MMANAKRAQPRPIDRLKPRDRATVTANVRRFIAYAQQRRLLTALNYPPPELVEAELDEAAFDDDDLEFEMTAPTPRGKRKTV